MPLGRRNSTSFWCLCPKCKDTSGHLIVNTSGKYRNLLYCVKCGYKEVVSDGVISTLIRKNRISDDTTPHLRLEERPNDGHKNGKREIRLWPRPEGRLPQEAYDYAIKRGMNPQFYPVYWDSSMPYYLIYKEETWWQGRTFRDLTPKNLFPTDLPKNTMFIKGDKHFKEVVIVEGIFDAIACIQPYRMVVALLGSVLKREQRIRLIGQLRGFEGPIKLFLDSDAVEKQNRIAKDLKKYSMLNVHITEWGHLEGDPDSIGPTRETLLNDARVVA